MERNPIFCDVIVRRFLAYAGEEAIAPEVAERYRLNGTQEVGHE